MSIKSLNIVSCLLIILSFSCNKKPVNEMVICTQVPVSSSFSAQKNNLYPEKARLIAFSLENPKKTFKVLTTEFFSASSPDVFYSGETVVFSAQKNQGDVWQIWELDLRNNKTRAITSEEFNCTDPMYLPTGEILFSRETALLTTKCLALFTCNPDGSKMQQITFHPHTDFSASILKDGRILHLSQQKLPKTGEQKLMAMRPDGTKSELFYQGESDMEISSRAWETANNKIVFVESNSSGSNQGHLISIDYNNPFHSKRLDVVEGQELLSVYPIGVDNYLLSAKEKNSNSFGVSLFNANTNSIEKVIYSNDAYHTFEPVFNKVKKRARKLPSAVNIRKKTGLFLCQNIHVSSLPSHVDVNVDSPVKIELLGLNKKLAVVEAEEDGSLYLEVKSDTPFRFKVVNDKGETIRGPSDWLWIRPNERWGCVGCHADREAVPDNYVPLAVKKAPLTVSTKSFEGKEDEK